MAMYRNILTLALIVLKAVISVSSENTSNVINPNPETTFEECFNKNSISCIQIQIYRSVRSFFDQDRVDLTAGISLVREEDSKNQAKARAAEDIIDEEQILEAEDFERRESTLESFVYRKLIAFFQERTVKWNFSPVFDEMKAARGIVQNLPDDLRQTITNLNTEGQFNSLFK